MKTDVVIVGGGLCGLCLADLFQRRGGDFRLLEARERFGGRMLTRRIAGAGFDLGPAWFWPGQPRMAALVARLRLRTFEQFASGAAAIEDRAGVVRREPGLGAMRGALRLEGGLQPLADALAGGIAGSRLRLGAAVRGVTRGAANLVVTADTADGPIAVEANRVVFAAPPRLVEARVRFDPALSPGQAAALRAIPTWMAPHAKVLALYDRPHWRDAGFSGDAFSQAGPLVEAHDASPRRGGPYALFGFVGVPADVRRERADDIVELSRRQLGRLFGEPMLQPLAIVLQDWAQDPFTATPSDGRSIGAHPAYGRPSQLENLWDGRLQFAGAEMAPASGGLLEGALEAAETIATAWPLTAALARGRSP